MSSRAMSRQDGSRSASNILVVTGISNPLVPSDWVVLISGPSVFVVGLPQLPLAAPVGFADSFAGTAFKETDCRRPLSRLWLLQTLQGQGPKTILKTTSWHHGQVNDRIGDSLLITH